MPSVRLRLPLAALLLLLLLGALAGAGFAADEAALLSILGSAAGAKERCEACRELLTAGSARCVPALAAALADERVGHAALHTLERLPFPEAGAALRTSLGSVTAPIKAGVIDALGWRREPAALAALIPLLRDPDEAVAAAAALALGRIGGPEASAALERGLENARAPVRQAVAEAILMGAETRLQAGDKAGAANTYALLDCEGIPEPLRAAAWRGLLLADEAGRAHRFEQAVAGNDPTRRRMALQTLPELRDPSLPTSLLARWETLHQEVKAALLENHGLLEGAAVNAAVAGAGDAQPLVRMAGLRILGELGHPAAVPVLARALCHGEKTEQLIARNSLAAVHGDGVEEAIRKVLAEARDGDRLALLQVLGRRATPSTAALLIEYAQDAEERTAEAALQSLALLAAPGSVRPLSVVALEGRTESLRRKAARGIAEICGRSAGGSEASKEFAAALEQVLPKLGNPEQGAAAADIVLTLADAVAALEPALAAKAARAILQQPSVPAEAMERARTILGKAEAAAK